MHFKKLIVPGLLLMVCFLQCTKPEEAHRDAYLYSVDNGSKTGNAFQLFVRTGHSGKNCQGCVRGRDGNYVHIPCQGYGNECSTTSQVIISLSGSDMIATTTDTFGLTTEDVFGWPARSIYFLDENKNDAYLNIPAQDLFRDSITQQFTLTGLSISSLPLYTNY